MQLTLDTLVSQLPGVGDGYNFRLQKLDIYTVKDLIYHPPSRYEDFSQTSAINQLELDQQVTIKGQITNFQNIRTRRGKNIQLAQISDGQSIIQAVWFNQVYLENVMTPGTYISLSGKIGSFNNVQSIMVPKFEKIPSLETTTTHTGRLISIYPETEGLSSKWIRAKIKHCLQHLAEIHDWQQQLNHIPKLSLPELLPLDTAIRQLHFPDSLKQAQQAQHRLAFDELFFLQINNQYQRKTWQDNKYSHPMTINSQQHDQFINNLPFQLTSAQERVIKQICKDLSQTMPMNRLLQGDVGSGKTVVAAYAAYIAHLNNFQTAVMAPTEILAQQHFQTLKEFLEALGVQVVLQTSSNKYIKPGKDAPFDLIVGTHALISDYLNFDRLGLVIIDEQHRFGVNQRAKLLAKATNPSQNQAERDLSTTANQDNMPAPDAQFEVNQPTTGFTPHLLSMTATPIPRTITLTIYGDLDVSIIDELPPGRKPVTTWVVPEFKRTNSYQWIQQQIDRYKAQVFIVCPFIESSETLQSVKAATEEFHHLQSIFPSLQLALLHGKQSASDKDQILQQFKNKKYDMLVTTPVVEVGVDIPNATIMVIEAAERFGLAQLHQLRGRVGRSHQQSYCLLFTSNPDAQQSRRLKALETTNDGLKLAETDLQIRGPGAIYGTQQHGYQILKFASYDNLPLVNQTRELALQVLPHLEQIPSLRKYLQTDKIDVAPN